MQRATFTINKVIIQHHFYDDSEIQPPYYNFNNIVFITYNNIDWSVYNNFSEIFSIVALEGIYIIDKDHAYDIRLDTVNKLILCLKSLKDGLNGYICNHFRKASIKIQVNNNIRIMETNFYLYPLNYCPDKRFYINEDNILSTRHENIFHINDDRIMSIAKGILKKIEPNDDDVKHFKHYLEKNISIFKEYKKYEE